eukprot:Gb_30608 [translate_table: standard]
MAIAPHAQFLWHINSQCYCPAIATRSRFASLRTREIQTKCTGGNSDRMGRREALKKITLLTVFIGGSVPSGHASGTKLTNLTIEEIKSIIENDIRKGQYYVTSNLTKEIYEDNCRFRDPTTDLTGLDKYIAAIKFLFNPDSSEQELLSIAVTSPNTIEAKWRLGGYLKFPWKPHISPYEGSTRYVLDDRGLIMSHEETWNISVFTALLEFLLPSWRPG